MLVPVESGRPVADMSEAPGIRIGRSTSGAGSGGSTRASRRADCTDQPEPAIAEQRIAALDAESAVHRRA